MKAILSIFPFFLFILFSGNKLNNRLFISEPVIQHTNSANSIQFFNPITYYVNPLLGSDQNSGKSKKEAFKTLAAIQQLQLHPGDKIVLLSNQTYYGSLKLIQQFGNAQNPIVITSETWNEEPFKKPALINFKGLAYGILLQDCGFIQLSNIALTANGFTDKNENIDMRCGVLVTNIRTPLMENILFKHLNIYDIFYENAGFVRSKEEVHSANGTQKYGWGIRIINLNEKNRIKNFTIANCSISNVTHTGIKLTGNQKNISYINILNNTIKYTGGPGIQMSEVQYVYVANNIVDHSGSNNDSRKWGRGSGLWTWGSSDIVIEKNQFLHANGPGDSDGAHIDFNCKNIIIQRNLSAYNAGGFCEILGNNYNCIYRYNISVNDGFRIKGVNGAFQEGKTLWLSGYQGNHQKRKGPRNTFIYNNTIYADSTIHPNIAFDNTSDSVMIANNIFYIINPFKIVLGDQYVPDTLNHATIKDMQVLNNLFLKPNSWPKEMDRYVKNQKIGNPHFFRLGNLSNNDYVPMNKSLVAHQGISIKHFSIDWPDAPFKHGLDYDILGKPVSVQPGIGAIEF